MPEKLFSPFSIRFRNSSLPSIKESLSFSMRLRNRIWRVMMDSNDVVRLTNKSGWNYDSDILTEVENKLTKVYGFSKLIAFLDNGENRGPVTLEGFVKRCYPSQFLDVIEMVYHELWKEEKIIFQAEINHVFQEENSPWILCDGYCTKIDSEFLSEQVIVQTSELLEKSGFAGPLEEFAEARNDLIAGDYKGAILNSCKAFESTLKAIENRLDGNPNILIPELTSVGFYSDLPDDIKKAFGNQVLFALPFIRNKLGGHGQGSEIIEVPRSFAELAVHLSGTFMVFLIRRNSEITGVSTEIKDAKADDDDLPF
jgi:hypothetical protein